MKSKREVLIIFFVLVQYFGSSSSETVSTEDGLVEGTVMISQLGASFNAFLRIPFAMPPVGDLRFQEPQPVRPWSGTLDATAYGPVCVQPNAVPFFDVSEDCLHLNVYSKDLTGSKPVIFFIHGGSFEFGTGMFEGPHYLMDRDLVVVTINYRLGSFGFLATGTKEAPGNSGMKDQVMALKWVNRNIARFGGDPNKITISGLSAGSVSVTALMVSPMARNLFHGVIAVSGTITGFNLLPSEYLDIAKDLSAKLNCATDNVEDMVACLKTVRFGVITIAPDSYRYFRYQRSKSPTFLWSSIRSAKSPLGFQMLSQILGKNGSLRTIRASWFVREISREFQ